MNFSSPTAYLVAALDSVYNFTLLWDPLQDPPPIFIVDPPPAKLGDNILDSVFNKDNILNTFILNLVPDTDKLELLMHEV
jgi:hypothetical protein